MTIQTPTLQHQDNIKISHLFGILWDYKIFIIIFTSICTTATVLYAINKPDEYTALGIYMPKSDNSASGLSKLAGQFGGLASLAGVNIGGGAESKTEVALELLKSRAFLQAFITRHNLTAKLLAVEGWDQETDTLLYNSELYDAENEVWVREPPKGRSVEPTSWEAFEALNKNIVAEYEAKRNILKLSFTYYSPSLAAQWLELLVKDMNDFWKQKQLNESKRQIELLNDKIDEIQLSEIREVFYALIAEQTKTRLLTQATEETIFETVANVIIPEEKSAPSRALLSVVGLIFSGFFACVISLLLGISKKREELYG